jgi:hypothetical protein
MQHSDILDAKDPAPRKTNIWTLFQLEMLLFSAIIYGIFYSRQGDRFGYTILLASLIGYIIFHFVAPFKKEEQMEVHWSWVLLWGLSFILVPFSSLLKVMSWPGAGLMMLAGFSLMSFSHLLLALISSWRSKILPLQKLLFWLLWLSMSFAIAGWYFFTMAWPNALTISMIGMIMGIGLLLFFIFKLFINWEEYNYLLFYLPRLAWATILASAIL